MRIDMMFADHAMLHQGKLFISGAGINVMFPRPNTGRYTISFGLGLTVTISPEAANQDHRLVMSMTDSDGRNVALTPSSPDEAIAPEDVGKIILNFNIRRPAFISVDEDIVMPLAFQFQGLEVPHLGAYAMRVHIDGVRKALARFRVGRAGAPEAKLALADP
jgi:hypothetical protein